MKIKNNSLIHNLIKILFALNFILIFSVPNLSFLNITLYLLNILSFWVNATLLNYYIKY